MNHEHLKQHLPFIVEMIESVKTVEFRQKWQIMKELIESNKLTVKQIETIELNIKKAKELKEQYKKTIVFTSLPNIDTKNDKETTKTVETVQNTSAKPEINELKIKKQMKELRRLHENIVKDEIPLPSKRRSALKRSYRDSLELLLDKSDDFPNLKKRKLETELEKKTAKDDDEGTKPSSKIVRKSLEAPKSSKIVTEARKSLGNPRAIKKASKLVENNEKILETTDLIETPIPITKSVGKIIKKPLDPVEASKPAQIKRKSLEISKPPPEKRKLKEVPEVVKQKRKSIEIAKPAQEQQKSTLIEEKKIPLKIKKSEEVIQKVPKSIEVTKSEPIILKISKASPQKIPIEPSKSMQEIKNSLDVSKIVKRKSKIPKPVLESPKKFVEITKPIKQVAKLNELPEPAQKEEHPKPLEIKKSSMNKLRKKIEKHQKKEVLKKKSRATLLTKGAAIKKGSKLDDDEWEDVDDSDKSEDEEDLDSGEEEIEKIMKQIHNVSKEDVPVKSAVESAPIKKVEAPITIKEDEQKSEPIKNPIIFKKVQNISYIRCKKGFIFKCLVQNCKFQTMDSPAFVDHIENEHLTIKWMGHCDICVEKVDTTRSIIFELMHMRENHVLKEVSNADNLPDITEHSEAEIVEKQEVNESSKVTKPEDEIKTDSKLVAAKTVEIKSTEKVALVGKKIDIGKIKLIPYKGTPLSPKSPEIGINKSIDLNKQEATKPAVIPVVEKDIQPDVSKAINSSNVETDKKQQEATDGKQKIIKHIIVKPPQDKEAIPLIVKPKQPNGPAQKVETVSTKPQVLSAEQKIVIQRQKSTDSQKDMSCADLLRPWLKRKVKKYLMPTTRFLNNVAAIISTYKCMSSKCSFYTSDRDLFNAHLRFHETHQTGDRDYMNCSYCDHIFNDKDQVIALVEHIENEHCFDKYQCKYCFYRSCVSLNVINHQHIYHAMKPKSVYELACDKNRDYEQELATVKKSRLKCVPPLSCVKCNAKFYLFPKLSAHMLTHGPNIKTKCTKCSKVSDLSNIHTHFINCHNLGLYQCVFCVFGSNNFDNIINHIGNCHPSKPPIYCERSNEKTDEVNPASIESTSLKFLTQQVDHRIIEASKIHPDILRNEKNVGDLGGNFKLYPAKTKSPNKEPQPVKKVPDAKLGSALKKVETKMASATELVKEIETIKKKSQKAQGISNEKSTGLQIKSVFSLNKF